MESGNRRRVSTRGREIERGTGERREPEGVTSGRGNGKERGIEGMVIVGGIETAGGRYSWHLFGFVYGVKELQRSARAAIITIKSPRIESTHFKSLLQNVPNGSN